MKQSICIVTEEWPGISGCGGIGTAFYELATLLSESQYRVYVLFVPIGEVPDSFKAGNSDINFHILEVDKYSYGPFTYQKKSFAVARWLEQSSEHFLSVHFCDYKGLGFASINLKRQGLAFCDTQLCVQLHGFTRWATELNGTFFDHEDQLMIDYLEKNSSLHADYVVSPSQYLLDWALERGYVQSKTPAVVIPNVCSSVVELSSKTLTSVNFKPKELIFVGRHESRKGLDLFVRAVIKNVELLRSQGVMITILGPFGTINETPSGLYLLNELGPTNLALSLKIDLDRFDVIDYLCQAKDALVVIPSPAENSPFTVLEPLMLNIPVITSSSGGARELFDAKGRNRYLFEPTVDSISARIKEIVECGITPAKVATTVKNTKALWLTELQKQHKQRARSTINDTPLVTVGITHYERPDKIVDAVSSMIMQDYSNIELLVIDDGSSTEAAIERLEYIETLLLRVGGRLIRQPNAYLGAARNRLIHEAKGEYIIFLDDDNYALPYMVSTLVKAICSAEVDIVTAQSIFMPLKKRAEFIARGPNIDEPVSYVPTGGPLSLAGISNVFGDASGIYRKSALKAVGGYTELRDVGYEDYELYTRLAQHGFSIASCPTPIYLYEIGRESMLSKNNMTQDYQRIFKAIQQGSTKEHLLDFTQIEIGSKVRQLSWNRKYYELSNHPLTETLLPLLTEPNDKVGYVSRLLMLAQTYNYTKFSAAILTSTRQAVNIIPKQINVLPKKEFYMANWLAANITEISDACLGDNPAVFIESLSMLCEKWLNMPVEVEQIICMWIRRIEQERNLAERFEASHARKFVEFLSQEVDNQSFELSVLVSIAAASITVEKFEVFWILIERILEIETEVYMNSYQDIHKAFFDAPEKVFQHFIRNGIRENRTGFKAALQLIKQALSSPDTIAIPLKQKLIFIKSQVI